MDAKVRKELRRWLRQLHDELHVTSIFVTHDQEEALEVSDQIIVMNQGQVEQQGSPEQVYQYPASPFVYGFLGSVNLFHGRLHEGILQAGTASFNAPEHQHVIDGSGTAYVRPHELDVQRYSPDMPGLVAQLKRVHSIGPLTQLELAREDNNELIEALLPTEYYAARQFKTGETLLVTPRRLHIFTSPESAPILKADSTFTTAQL